MLISTRTRVRNEILSSFGTLYLETSDTVCRPVRSYSWRTQVVLVLPGIPYGKPPVKWAVFNQVG
jgi:hypothetical protein